MSDLEILVLGLSLVVHTSLVLVGCVELRHDLLISHLLTVHLFLSWTCYQRCRCTPLVWHLLHIGLDRVGVLQHHILSSYETRFIWATHEGRIVEFLTFCLHHLHYLVIRQATGVEIAHLAIVSIREHYVVSLLILNLLRCFPLTWWWMDLLLRSITLLILYILHCNGIFWTPASSVCYLLWAWSLILILGSILTWWWKYWVLKCINSCLILWA